MVEYDPSKVSPALHRVFADICSQSVVVAENEGRLLSDDPGAPFHMRSFEDVPSAIVAFVNEYGFIGSDRTGADAEAEDVVRLMAASGTLRTIMHWTQVQSSKSRLQRALSDDGILEQALSGPNLRMVVATGRLHGRMQVHYEPESLYAWMWLRTAEDFANGVNWSGPPCLYCLQPIGRGPGAHRPQAKFCSDTHRTYFDRLSPVEKKRRTKEAIAVARSNSLGPAKGA